MQKASASIHIGRSDFEGKGWVAKQETKALGGNAFEFTFAWQIEHFVRTYGYYLVVADCHPAPRHRFHQMEYEISFYNHMTDHFPADERGLPSLYFLCFLSLGGYGLHQIIQAYRGVNTVASPFFAGLSSGPPPAATTLLIFAYCCQFISVFFELLHYWWYAHDGHGLFVIDFGSEALEGISQTALAYLLLAFAGGWTLVEGTMASKKDGMINPDALGDDHPSTVFLGFMSIITFVLQLLNKLIMFDEFSKFHQHDSWPGFLLVMGRTALAVFFTYQLYQTIQYMTKRKAGKNHSLQFMRSLAFFGGLWFWVFPVLVFVSSVFAHYLRHRIVTGGTLLLQTICLIVLTHQVFQESSAYSKASLHRGVVLGGTGA